MHSTSTALMIFIILCTTVILLLVTLIVFFVYKYQQKQHKYYREIEELKVIHENSLLQSQIEIQEQTFQNISREIHDNIGQKLTLAKLHLNTITIFNNESVLNKVQVAVQMIGDAIIDLSDLSRSMSSEIILQNGFIKALEFEVKQLSKVGLYKINLIVSGNTMFLHASTELVLFRIIQEAINNIIKHSGANQILISLDYSDNYLSLNIEDNGSGISSEDHGKGIGLHNMSHRAKLLGGEFNMLSNCGIGSKIFIKIPLNGYKQAI